MKKKFMKKSNTTVILLLLAVLLVSIIYLLLQGEIEGLQAPPTKKNAFLKQSQLPQAKPSPPQQNPLFKNLPPSTQGSIKPSNNIITNKQKAINGLMSANNFAVQKGFTSNSVLINGAIKAINSGDNMTAVRQIRLAQDDMKSRGFKSTPALDSAIYNLN